MLQSDIAKSVDRVHRSGCAVASLDAQNDAPEG
jgi:hypothetical protein